MSKDHKKQISINDRLMEDIALTEGELEEFIEILKDRSMRSLLHFNAAVRVLARCYGETEEKPMLQSVVIVNDPVNGSPMLFSVNCTDMEVASLLNESVEALGIINTLDAPPKEMFN
jgi:hypothetical protein